MFKYLKKKSIQKHTDKNLNKRDLSQLNAPLKTLGILFDEVTFQDAELFYEYSQLLGLQPKDVKLFSYVDFEKKAPTLRQNQINNKDFAWDGGITNESALEFLTTPFDVLLGYYNGNHEFLDFMVSKSVAKFKVGGKGADFRLFDLIIEIDLKSTENFKAEFKKYLEVLNKI